MLCVLISAYALFANAQVALEDANGYGIRIASYSQQFVEAQNAPLGHDYRPVGNGQCVAFVRAHGFEYLSGNALEWTKYINTNIPITGGVVVLRESKLGHLALILSVRENDFSVVEQNYKGLYIVSYRKISRTNPDIIGFIQ